MKKLIALALLCIALSGCCSTETQISGAPRYITGITAHYQSGSITLDRSYTDPEKTRAVMTYLRLLSPRWQVQDSAPATSSAWIRLTLSDGTTRLYEQICDSQMRIDGGQWLQIDPDKGRELPLLLGLMESD